MTYEGFHGSREVISEIASRGAFGGLFARQAIEAADRGDSRAREYLALAKHRRAYAGASPHIARRASAALARAGIRH